MTRLQRMFIQLSQYKTVKELEKATSKLFVEDLFTHLAFDENGKVSTCGHFVGCQGCVIGCHNSGLNPDFLTINYFNEEIDGSNPLQNSTIFIRDKALKEVQERFNIACKERLNPYITAKLLDSYCELLENIGLFEPYECHDMLLKITKETHK